jgi:hypothetical protein
MPVEFSIMERMAHALWASRERRQDINRMYVDRECLASSSN